MIKPTFEFGFEFSSQQNWCFLFELVCRCLFSFFNSELEWFSISPFFRPQANLLIIFRLSIPVSYFLIKTLSFQHCHFYSIINCRILSSWRLPCLLTVVICRLFRMTDYLSSRISALPCRFSNLVSYFIFDQFLNQVLYRFLFFVLFLSFFLSSVCLPPARRRSPPPLTTMLNTFLVRQRL